MRIIDGEEVVRKLKMYIRNEPMFKRYTEDEFNLIALGVSLGIYEVNRATEIDYNKYSEWVITEEDGVKYLTCPFCEADYDVNTNREFCSRCGAILEGGEE